MRWSLKLGHQSFVSPVVHRDGVIETTVVAADGTAVLGTNGDTSSAADGSVPAWPSRIECPCSRRAESAGRASSNGRSRR